MANGFDLIGRGSLMTGHESEPRIVDTDTLSPSGETDAGGRWKRVGLAAGGERLGCTLEEIAPGERPASYHYHAGNEEALYVLEGEGTLETPTGETTIRAGDYVAFPAGERGVHAVENTSDAMLVCLFVSTMNEPDVIVYPDEGELRVFAGAPPGRPVEEFALSERFEFDVESGGERGVSNADEES
jgi:uncharacterized cupin superfamily protein